MATMNDSPRTPRSPGKKKRSSSIFQSQTTIFDRRAEGRKRSSTVIEEQVLLIKDLQNAIEKILKEIDGNSGSAHGFERKEEELQSLLNKSQELLVMLQVMMKIRNELAYARIDLEKAVKFDRGVEIAKKRVKWLQKRLDKVISTTRSYCLVNLSAESCLEKSDVSGKMWDFLNEGQHERYFTHKDDHHGFNRNSVIILNDFSKMVLKRNPSDVLVTQNEVSSHVQQVDGVETRKEGEQTGSSSALQKQSSERKKKKKIKTRSVSDSLVPVTAPDDDLYDGEGDSSPEPTSDLDHDDGTAESLMSSVGPLPETQLSKPATTGSGQLVKVQTVDSSTSTQEPEDSESSQEYWDLDHHKFEWCNYMLQLDPRSWHALGIAVQESFVPKEKHKFDASIPWREKPMKVNSVIDVHKIALDKLLLRLHQIYETIGQVTQATIDPLPKEQRVETVMGKQDVSTPWEGRTATAIPATAATGTPGARETVLPPLPEALPKSLTLIPMSPEPKHGCKKSDKYFPRDSKEWCDDIKSGYNMPRLVNFKPPSIYKKTSNVQSRYLGSKPVTEEKPTQINLFRKDEWKPAVVKRLIGAVRAFDSGEGSNSVDTVTVEKDTPRWRRLMELTGPSGLKSSNQNIAMEAAKALGQLNCRHEDIITALIETICDGSKEPRVLYEASKALILLGTWSPQAMSIIIEHIKKGNELVVKELLYTMTKAKNIPFVDKTTPEFRMLVYLLIELVKVDHHPLSFRACISLGRLCVVEPVSRGYLIRKLSTFTEEAKSEALLVLIKQMNCKDEYVMEALLDHLCTAHNWKNRLEAAELLVFIGARDLFKILSLEKVFDVLERLLWDHSNKEFRAKVAEVINVLGLRQAVSSLVLKRLEDSNEDVRARAVISLATLGMRGMKEMKVLLDLLELDSSVYVRLQVIRAFSHLKWNDPRIIRALRERERGDGTLASEARKAISKLLEEER